MRMLLNISIPHEPFNEAVRAGTAGSTLNRIIEEAKPEAVYFTEQDGSRHAVMVVDLKSPSDVPRYAEPWFLAFQASCEFRVAMTPKDLAEAGIEKIGKHWT